MDKLQIYQMLKMLYPLGRVYLIMAIDNPKSNWDEKLLNALDDLFGKTDSDEISRAMIIIEWTYRMSIRAILLKYVPASIIGELDKFLDYV
jgi:hypothetical protein